jgi:hypothetical protein
VKALALAAIVIVFCTVLFLAGVISPKRSRKLQKGVDKLARKGEVKADRNAGKLGDATQTMLEKSREAADASARAGRRLRGESR